MHVLQGHTSPQTAHLSLNYPFGRSVRCVRREWIEQAQKGAHKALFRFVTQTTTKIFNLAYTAKIEADGQESADAWAQAEIAAGRASWNAQKPSTYTHMNVMVEAPLDDGSGRVGVKAFGIHLGCGPAALVEFRQQTAGQLLPAQAASLSEIEKIDRILNKQHWERFEAAA